MTYRYFRCLKNIPRNMSFGQIPGDGALDLIHQLPGKFHPGLHEQEQHDTLVRILRSALSHTDTILHLVGKVPLDDAVDLGRPEPHARRVQHAVCPAEEVYVPRDRVDLAEIAVGPDVVEPGEIRAVVFGPGGGGGFFVSPEETGDVGEGVGRDELAVRPVLDFFPWPVGEERVVDGYVEAERWALGAAHVDGGERVQDPKTPRDVGAARDVAQVDAGGEPFVVEPLEQLVGEDHAGAGDHAQTGQIRHLSGGEVILGQLVHPARADTELGHLLLGCRADEDARVGLERRAVVEDGPAAE